MISIVFKFSGCVKLYSTAFLDKALRIKCLSIALILIIFHWIHNILKFFTKWPRDLLLIIIYTNTTKSKYCFSFWLAAACLRAPSSVSRVYHSLLQKNHSNSRQDKNGLFRKMSTHIIVLFKCAILPPEVFTPLLEQTGVVKMRETLQSLKCNCDLHFFPRQSHRNEL